MSNAQKRQVLDEIVKDTDNPVDFLEGVLEHTGIPSRELVQLYCIYKFKYDLGVKYGRETTWEEAGLEWVDSGNAKRYGEFYDGRRNLHTLYEASTRD